jgi:hypothetical protein
MMGSGCASRHILCVAIALCCAAAPAQPVTPAPANAANATQTHIPPAPTPPRSPVDLFRSVLTMSPAERRDFLSQRPPEAQKLILAKIREYEGLTPELRELRLRVTELRWYLLPLLNTPAADRSARISAIQPNDLRELIETRLREWDKLSPEVQKEFLENESIIRFYFELAARTPGQRAEFATNDVGQSLQPGLGHWQNLSSQRRQEILRHFYQYFDLSAAEKRKTLETVSEPERVEIEKTLQTFGGLSPAQRIQCVRSFQKFASFTPEERRQFLQNAERWERMSPSDRQAWRNLVSNLSHQPPMPPGFEAPPLPSGPAPSALEPTKGSSSWATNSN